MARMLTLQFDASQSFSVPFTSETLLFCCFIALNIQTVELRSLKLEKATIYRNLKRQRTSNENVRATGWEEVLLAGAKASFFGSAPEGGPFSGFRIHQYLSTLYLMFCAQYPVELLPHD